MNYKESELTPSFQRITMYLFWEKTTYKGNAMRSCHASLPQHPVGISLDAFITRGVWAMIQARSFLRTCWLCLNFVAAADSFTGPNFWSVSALQNVSDMAIKKRNVCQRQETQWTVLSEACPRFFPTCSVLSFFAILHRTTYLSLGCYCISQWGCYPTIFLGMFSIATALTAFSLSDYSMYSSPTE